MYVTYIIFGQRGSDPVMHCSNKCTDINYECNINITFSTSSRSHHQMMPCHSGDYRPSNGPCYHKRCICISSVRSDTNQICHFTTDVRMEFLQNLILECCFILFVWLCLCSLQSSPYSCGARGVGNGLPTDPAPAVGSQSR